MRKNQTSRIGKADVDEDPIGVAGGEDGHDPGEERGPHGGPPRVVAGGRWSRGPRRTVFAISAGVVS
jgi:hypothetical protein